MTQLEEIISGWKNYIFPNEEIEETAKKRIKICLDCPYLRKNKVCSLCGCYMPAKVRSTKSKCKKMYW